MVATFNQVERAEEASGLKIKQNQIYAHMQPNTIRKLATAQPNHWCPASYIPDGFPGHLGQ